MLNLTTLSLLICLLLPLNVIDALAQMPRERANQRGPVQEMFWTPSLMLMSSAANLEKNNLDFTIKHVFGIATNGPEDLFGLDAPANVRFGIDYGISDRISIGFGRSKFEKLYDFRGKINILRQTQDNSTPLEIAFAGNIGISTLANGYDFLDKLSYSSTLHVARKFSERFSLQFSPTYTHFNLVSIERDIDNSIIDAMNDHVAIGIAGHYAISQRVALLIAVLPVVGKRSDNTRDAAALGVNLETGGHVFQLFFTTTQSMTEQHVISKNNDRFLRGDFRFGFNVFRTFSTGG